MVDEAADDGVSESVGLLGVEVFQDWFSEGSSVLVGGRAGGFVSVGVIRVEAVGAFPYVPAVVGSFGDDVEFFPAVLSFVCGEQGVVAGGVEADFVGVA